MAQSIASDENLSTPTEAPDGNIPLGKALPEPHIRSPNKDERDLLPRIRGMFRLLDLINERGSSGIGQALKTHPLYVLADPHA